MDKLPSTAKGAFIYTLLSGKALEAVTHLEPDAYQKEGGDDIIWKLLDARFPQKEKVDELGELLGDIFSLKAKEGETMKTWAARCQETFADLKRVLASARANGTIDQVISQILSDLPDSEFELISEPGAMTDGTRASSDGSPGVWDYHVRTGS